MTALEKADRFSLQEAFEKVVAQPMWWVGIKDDAKKATYFKQAYKDGRVSEAKMREILRKSSYRVVQQEMWSKKNSWQNKVMAKQKFTSVAEVGRAIGANAYGLKLLKYLDEYFPQDALDYDFIMAQAKLAAQVAEEYVREHGTDSRNQVRAEELAYERLLGVYAGAFSKYAALFYPICRVIREDEIETYGIDEKEVILRLMPKFEPIFEKYGVNDPNQNQDEFSASCEDDLTEDIIKKAKKILPSEIEKMKKEREQAELDKLPF